MVVTDLRRFGLELKSELENQPSVEIAKKIAIKIETATHSDGLPLTTEEKGHVIKYIELYEYDHTTGEFAICHSDNSSFLSLVKLVSQAVKQNK